MTRIAEYGTAEWRRWKHDHHWAGSGAAVDPLGAGNTALISALGGNSVVLGFYDVRIGVTATSTVSAWADVRGTGFLGSLTPVTTGPAWTGGTDAQKLMAFTGANGNALASAATSALDLTNAISLIVICSFPAQDTFGRNVASIGDSGGGHGVLIGTDGSTAGNHITVGSIVGGTLTTGVLGGNSTRRVVLLSRGAGTSTTVSGQVPAQALVTTGATTTVAGNNRLVVGAYPTGNAALATAMRAVIVLAGAFTPTQEAAVATYAENVNYHNAVAA